MHLSKCFRESVGNVSRILTLYLSETVPESRSKESTRQRSISRYSLTPFLLLLLLLLENVGESKPLLVQTHRRNLS